MIDLRYEMNVLEENTVCVKSEDVVFRTIEGETIILNIKNSTYYDLNEVGTEIWERTDGEKSIIDIAKDISKIYDVSVEKAKKDIIKLYSDFFKEKLIKAK